MAKRRSRKGQDDQPEAFPPDQETVDNVHVEQPSSDEDTGASLPLDVLLQAKQDAEVKTPSEEQESEEADKEDFASLLASLQDQEAERGQKSDVEETEEDRELSQMISLMASHDPGLTDFREAKEGRETQGEADEALEALPEGTEVVFDREEGRDLMGATGGVAEGGVEETALASVAGDEIVAGESDISEQDRETALASAIGDEGVEEEEIEDYDVTDTADALLSTIGLDDEQEVKSFVPPIPEGGIRDDGTPVEELVHDRILDDFQELHENLKSPAVPLPAGVSALMGLPDSLTETHARILCIDDDPDNRSLFNGVLASEDYTFVDAESGEEALEILRDGEVDLVLLNLDIASQDGFELIEEAASDVVLSQIPILVNSASTEHIEKALRLGASDYFILPMSVIDVKFQIPIKVKNLLKIRRAERVLALVGDAHYGDLVAAPPMKEGTATEGEKNGDLSGGEAQAKDLLVSGDEDLSSLLTAGEDEEVAKGAEALGTSVREGEEESLEDLFGEDQKDDEGEVTAEADEAEEDLAAGVAGEEKGLEELGEEEEDLDKLFEEEVKSEAGEGEEDLAAGAAGEEEDLFEEAAEGEEVKSEADEAEADLVAGVAGEEKGLEELGEEEEDLDKLFEEDTLERSYEVKETSEESEEELRKRGGLAVAGAAAAAVGAAAMRPEKKPDEASMPAARAPKEPLRKGPAPIWRSPDLVRSDRERQIEMPRRSGRRRLLYAVLALLLVGVGIYALWAKQRLRDTGDTASILPAPLKSEAPEVSAPSPAESESEVKPKLEVESESPTVTTPARPSGREAGDFEQARRRASVPSREEQQLTEAKVHFRAAVDQIASTGGQWWAPWRVMKASGESIKELVNERRRDDILEVFGANERRVEQGLKRKSVVNFLSKRGFKIRGKQASDLSAREVFEVLSMREIRTRDKVVAVLSALKEKAAAARAERAARLKATRPSRLALQSKPLKIDLLVRSVAVWERPVRGRTADSRRQTAEVNGRDSGYRLWAADS